MTILYILFTFAILFLMKLVSLTGHEMGHATPALIFTKDKVAVYLGSYGDTENSHKISMGRFDLFYKLNPLTWFWGCCISEKQDLPFYQNFLIVLLGPIFSLLMGMAALGWTFAVDRPDSYITFGLFFFISCTLDFIFNIFPNSNPFTDGDTSLQYNDGAILLKLLSYKKNNEAISEGTKFYDAKEYKKAFEVFIKLSQDNPTEEYYLQYALSSLAMDGRFQEALETFRKYKESNTIYSSSDYVLEAQLKNKMGYPELALDDYKKALTLNPNNIYALNNRGELYNKMHNYNAALNDLNKAIELDKNFAFAYNNRGFTKIKLGQTTEAIQDINKSISLNPNNGYAFFYKGIYHFEMGEKEAAFKAIKKAYKMDEQIDGLVEYMEILK